MSKADNKAKPKGDVYEEVAREVARIPVKFLDPSKIKAWAEKEDVPIPTKKEWKTVETNRNTHEAFAVLKKFAPYKEKISEFMRSHIGEDAISISDEELIDLYFCSQRQGEFSYQTSTYQLTSNDGEAITGAEVGSRICIINKSFDDENTRETALVEMLGKAFNSDHFKQLPPSVNTDFFTEFVARHEGEHCNQDLAGAQESANLQEVLKNKVLELKNEILSDREGLKPFRNDRDAVQIWSSMRAIGAGNGDRSHATGIFLSDPNTLPEITEAHLNAANRLQEEMFFAVGKTLDISINDAAVLRTSDPQKFAKTLQSYLDTGGTFPVEHRILNHQEISAKIAKDIGIKNFNPENDSFTPDQFDAVLQSYRRMEENNTLSEKGKENPHIETYVKAYIDATKVLFIEDTSPKNPRTPEDIQVDRQKNLDFAQQDAAEQSWGKILDTYVAGKLGIQESDLNNIDPDIYLAIVEDGLRNTKDIPTRTTREATLDEKGALIAQKLGLPADKIYNPEKAPPFLYKLAHDDLERKGAFKVTEDNPAILASINEYLYTEKKGAEIPDKEVGGAPEENTVSVNLEMGEMKINGASPTAYFNAKSDPAAAAFIATQLAIAGASLSSNQQIKAPSLAFS